MSDQPSSQQPTPANRPTSVIVAGARTPMGRLLGSLKDFSAVDVEQQPEWVT